MSRNQYAGMLYVTHTRMVDAVVEDWLTGQGGGPSLADSLAENTDDAVVADELIADGWIACHCNGEPGPDEGDGHDAGCLEDQGVDRDDVLDAIKRLRERVEDDFTRAGGACILAGEAFGHYHINGNAEIEDWAEVQTEASRVERIDDLAGWSRYTAAYRVWPADVELPALLYFVAEPVAS